MAVYCLQKTKHYQYNLALQSRHSAERGFCIPKGGIAVKIICTKEEFALLVRNCWHDYADEECKSCWFCAICSQMNAVSETEIMSCIDDICVIEDGE
jgi:hypothetical protein